MEGDRCVEAEAKGSTAVLLTRGPVQLSTMIIALQLWHMYFRVDENCFIYIRNDTLLATYSVAAGVTRTSRASEAQE